MYYCLSVSQAWFSTLHHCILKSMVMLQKSFRSILNVQFGITTFFVEQTDHLAYNCMSFFASVLCCATIYQQIAVTEHVIRRHILIRFGNERMQEVEPMTYVLFECYFSWERNKPFQKAWKNSSNHTVFDMLSKRRICRMRESRKKGQWCDAKLLISFLENIFERQWLLDDPYCGISNVGE